MDLQTSFQDGCSTIAAAITSIGVITAANASPATMANNIRNIETEPVFTSKTVTANDEHAGFVSSLSFNTGITGKTYGRTLFVEFVHIPYGSSNSNSLIGQSIVTNYNSSTGVVTLTVTDGTGGFYSGANWGGSSPNNIIRVYYAI